MKDDQIIFAVLCTTLLLLTLVGAIFIIVYVYGKRRLEQRIEISQLELGFEKELRKVEFEVRESMTDLFAHELHDNLGHALTCMRITIENKKIDQPELDSTFSPIEQYLDEASEQLHMLSRTLNTDYITNIGLLGAIRLEIDRITQLKRFHLVWKCYDVQVGLNKDQELMVFRIFQEITHNVLKHARAKELVITLNTTNGFELIVADDGRGFNRDDVLNSNKASGLKNIIKRATMAGMTCSIESEPGKGCKYILTEI